MKKVFLILSLIFSSISFAAGPVSVQVVTGSYTVPARKWARVTAHVIQGGAFTINGSTALSSVNSLRSWSVLASDNYQHWNHSTLGRAEMSITSTTNATSLGVGTGFNENTAYSEAITSETATFKIPSGSVINGSGTWRATVELYER